MIGGSLDWIFKIPKLSFMSITGPENALKPELWGSPLSLFGFFSNGNYLDWYLARPGEAQAPESLRPTPEDARLGCLEGELGLRLAFSSFLRCSSLLRRLSSSIFRRFFSKSESLSSIVNNWYQLIIFFTQEKFLRVRGLGFWANQNFNFGKILLQI
jgi:hypothetical protein